MRGVRHGVVLSVMLSAAALAKGDPTTQIVIMCDCVGRYPAWMCEAFWWALC